MKYKIIIPKEEPKQKLPIINGSYGCTIETDKQETLEDFIKRESKSANESVGIVKGSKWQQEQDKKLYSEEDMKYAFDSGRVRLTFDKERPFVFKNYEEFIEQFKNK
jgi:hypothetical protein